MIKEEISELLHRHPFEPFEIHTTGGDRYKVADSALAALLRSGVFIAFANSDRRVIVPLLHIASVESSNGRRSRSRRSG